MKKWTITNTLAGLTSHSTIFAWLMLFTQVMCFACNDIPANNPYDPVAPQEIIRRVNIKGRVINKLTSEPIIGAVLTLAGPSGANI